MEERVSINEYPKNFNANMKKKNTCANVGIVRILEVMKIPPAVTNGRKNVHTHHMCVKDTLDDVHFSFCLFVCFFIQVFQLILSYKTI